MSADQATPARDEKLASLLAAPPPRPVPPELLRAAGAQGPPWYLALVGLMFMAMGFFFVRVFFPWHFFEDWQLRDAPTVTGRILTAAPTSLSVNKQRVYRYEFEFQPPSAVQTLGACYTTGRLWNPGATVMVRYLPDRPQLSCVKGARLSQGSAGSALLLVFPLVGGGMIAWLVVGRRRQRWLLEYGQMGEALVTEVVQTSVRINNQYVYKITLQRADATGDTPVTLRHYQPAQVALARTRLASKQPVFVLYDPAHPRRALLPEALL